MLLVEDDPLVVIGTVALLEDPSHTVEASSAEASLSVLRHDIPIDLPATDYATSGMTGLELEERIRAEWPMMLILLASS
ncbi:hypothetical protein [Microvirga sp. P5_D2]